MGRTPKNKEVNEKLDEVLANIEKQFGKGLITNLSDDEVLEIERIPTGSMLLDDALGGGIPRGRIIEVYGAQSCGKTTLLNTLIANVQKAGGRAAFIDAEHAYDKNYAKMIGVDINKLLFCQPDYGEQALQVAEQLVESGQFQLIGIDSVSALVPKAELEGEIGDSHMGLQARLMSQAMRKLTGIASKTNTTLYFTNQIRKKIGVVYGSPNTTSGGEALKFYASVRMEMTQMGTIKKSASDKEVLATQIRVKVVKNKVAPPYREANIEIYFDEGISKISDIISLGFNNGIFTKSGAWMYYGEEKFQGETALRDYVKTGDNADRLRKEIIESIKAQGK